MPELHETPIGTRFINVMQSSITGIHEELQMANKLKLIELKLKQIELQEKGINLGGFSVEVELESK